MQNLEPNIIRNLSSRKINQALRILKVYLLMRSYYIYAKLETSRRLLSGEHTYDSETEKFLHDLLIGEGLNKYAYDKNNIANVMISDYDEYNRNIKICEPLGISRNMIESFCKSMAFGNTIYTVKLCSCYYMTILYKLFYYICQAVSKNELESQFFEITPITSERTKLNTILLRKVFIQTEKLLQTIQEKEEIRSKKKMETAEAVI